MKNGRGFFLFIVCFSMPILVAAQEKPDALTASGKASFYHDDFQGRLTSSGEEYDRSDFTAAHRTLPFGTFVHVTNKLNGRSVVVRINDRGPFKKSRIIDLTRASAMKLRMVPFGVVPVKIQVLTVLDRMNLNDSIINENELWDCFGNKGALSGLSLSVWKTESLKHAFYMASDILLDYRLEKVMVKACGKIRNRTYELIVSGLDTLQSRRLLNAMRTDGFFSAKAIKPAGLF